MKKGITLASLAAVLTIGIWSCSNSKKLMDDIPAFSLNDTTTLLLDEVKVCADDAKLFVEFDTLYNDSRCPKNTACIWEGDAQVGLKITYGKELEMVQMCTNTTLEENKLSLYGYDFQITGLLPYPGDKETEALPLQVQFIAKKSQ